MALCAGLVVVACSSGSKPTAVQLTSTPDLAGATSSAAGSGSVTPLNADAFQLETATGVDNAFTISIPAGWQPEQVEAPGGFGSRWVWMENGNRVAQVTVRCQRGVSVEQMMKNDATIILHLRGTYDMAQARSVSVGGLQATQADYGLSFTGFSIEQRAVYFVSAPCGWRIVLQAFGDGQRERYGPLFGRVVSTFRLAPEGG